MKQVIFLLALLLLGYDLQAQIFRKLSTEISFSQFIRFREISTHRTYYRHFDGRITHAPKTFPTPSFTVDPHISAIFLYKLHCECVRAFAGIGYTTSIAPGQILHYLDYQAGLEIRYRTIFFRFSYNISKNIHDIDRGFSPFDPERTLRISDTQASYHLGKTTYTTNALVFYETKPGPGLTFGTTVWRRFSVSASLLFSNNLAHFGLQKIDEYNVPISVESTPLLAYDRDEALEFAYKNYIVSLSINYDISFINFFLDGNSSRIKTFH